MSKITKISGDAKTGKHPNTLDTEKKYEEKEKNNA